MKQTDIAPRIARELSVQPWQVEKTVELLDGGNTVPFIARYRKEVTGSLLDEQIRTIEERLGTLRNLVKRQEEILAKIDEQGKLTPDLRKAIENAQKLTELEDYYLPYKQKRRTRAQQAREKGLEPLATAFLLQRDQKGDALTAARAYVDPDKGVETPEDALAGARDIVAELAAEDPTLRQTLREQLWNHGFLQTELVEDAEEAQTFLMYADYREPVRTLPSHRVLAINRGEKKGCLKVHLLWEEERALQLLQRRFVRHRSIYQEQLELALEDSWKRLLFPALEREIRHTLTENAEAQAIRVFGANLRQLLLQAPLAGRTVMGLDPGYRTGCKVAVVDPTGQVVDHGVIQVTQSEKQKEQAEEILLGMIQKHHVTLLSIGNGTASYETEQFAARLIQEHQLKDVHYLITNEAGASVYSASKLAQEELPEYDVTIRGAVSMARRVQDPLAELVKIDPQAIGVGQYQHDMPQKRLDETLEGVVEDCVNSVGVDLNTASVSLLSHVSGVNSTVAKNIVAYREAEGAFRSRKELLKVPKLGAKAYEQCAGFLRVPESAEMLDNTAVHPESYRAAKSLLLLCGSDISKLPDELKRIGMDKAAEECGIGVPTLKDILRELQKPGRDPRDELPKPLLRSDVMDLKDLKPGMVLKGTVRNVIDFGAFVDIGVHQDGLVHISQMTDKYIKHPLEAVSVGDVVDVEVMSVDIPKKRIQLTMKLSGKHK